MQNHHLTSVSTSPEKTAQQFFYSAEPISDRVFVQAKRLPLTLHRKAKQFTLERKAIACMS